MAVEINPHSSTPRKAQVQPSRAPAVAKRVEKVNRAIEANEVACDPPPSAFICGLRDTFRHLAARTATAMGSPWTFAIALASVLIWAALGPHFKYSETWQLVINTSTTIVTFLMIFLVQNTQNRDSRAIHLKLDELLHGVKGARSSLVDLEDATDEELEALQSHFKTMRSSKAKEEDGDESNE